MDKDFTAYWDKQISEGVKGWEQHTNMHCNQGETLKDQQQCDPAGPPTDYMKSQGVFKASKTNAYDLCRFYCVSPAGDFPSFPAPHEPATPSMIKDLLGVAWAAKCSHLFMVFAGKAATTVCQQRQHEVSHA